MQEFVDLLISNPLFVAGALASFVGLFIYWSYGGFINENYRRIKWFRRLFLPHITALLHIIDEENEDIDLEGVYVETDVLDKEHAFDLYLREGTHYLGPLKGVTSTLIDNHFRPEVILASLGTNSTGNQEVGNFVLTAPEKAHPDATGLGRLYDIIKMFTSKYQLHVRIFYDEDKHRLRFYAHHELNPYNPLYAKRHLEAEEFDEYKGVRLLRKYSEDMLKYGVEVAK